MSQTVSSSSVLSQSFRPSTRFSESVDGLEVGFARLRGEFAFQVVVHFDPVEAGVGRRFEVLPQRHPIGIWEGPQVDRFFEGVLFSVGATGFFCASSAASAWLMSPWAARNAEPKVAEMASSSRRASRGNPSDEGAFDGG